MKIITNNEIKKLQSENKLIFFRNNYVYDITDWDFHPGGKKCLENKKNLDVTNDYNFHSKKGKKEWKKFCIGKLENKRTICVIC